MHYLFANTSSLSHSHPLSRFCFCSLLCGHTGKTIEVLALVLGNPALPSSLLPPPPPTNKSIKSKIPTRATLIVVPGTLIPQWWEEIMKRTPASSSGGEFRALNMSRNLANREIGMCWYTLYHYIII